LIVFTSFKLNIFQVVLAGAAAYTSKWNPIEHRVFPHVTRAMQGVILSDHDMVKQLIEKTQTKTGLSVSVSIIDKVYELGKKATDGFKESMKIVFDEFLGRWNYRAIPMPGCS